MKAGLRLLALAIFIILILQGTLAADINATYQVFDNKALVELSFGNVDALELKIPSDVAALELNTNSYNVSDFESYKLLKVGAAADLEIKYTTASLVETSGSKNFFVLQNSLGGGANVKVFLPEGAVLVENSLVLPKADEISTDGRRIILEWREFKGESIIAAYEFIGKSNGAYLILIAVIVVGVAVYLIIGKLKIVRRKKHVGTKKGKRAKERGGGESRATINLFGEEKKIIEYLLVRKSNESWTKEISRELEIPKVRLSRKLRALEQKELIKKTPYGNENRIKLLKK